MAEVYLLGTPDIEEELSRLRTRSLNFDPAREALYIQASGWHVDDYSIRLPPEAPGPPVKGGSWETARRLSMDFKFVNADVVRAFYDRREPLETRTMLIEVHFLGLRIYAGVRVGEVVNGEIDSEGRAAWIFSWNYRTLENHFEMGQISYEVWKWLDSGEVEFRIHAYSRRADPGNLLVRWGFGFFGRRKQIAFARDACERMAALTTQVLGARPAKGLVSRPRTGESNGR